MKKNRIASCKRKTKETDIDHQPGWSWEKSD